MRKFAIAGIAALAIAGTTAVYAQHQWFGDRIEMFADHIDLMRHGRLSAEDRAALADAKIAGVHAGLKLTAEQEKLWPPVESAVRDLVKIRIDRAKAREAAAASGNDQAMPDPVTRWRDRAERMAATATALKKVADAADPLYKTLDDGQKRRLAMLMHHHHGEGWRERFQHRFGGDRDRGPDSERL
ncbi:Spy/CpxP family protein refolding chaperone [Bradyrhizobium sp.]|uniref:Spy/CpxP family protein refolding chaperone n=1 Tax=Bradyrhizobium sp. TaxID=376 RepID=UPI0026044F4A|nr:Spy/CpxP family protein refolding chaperone [Bradyrhizobium sp.]